MKRPLYATQWERVVVRAGRQCECQGECGGVKKRHELPEGEDGKRCQQPWYGGAGDQRLFVTPRDLRQSEIDACLATDAEVMARCGDCLDDARARIRAQVRQENALLAMVGAGTEEMFPAEPFRRP